MRAVLRLGPLWIAPLRKPLPGAALGFADACGDASLILTADQCRDVAATLVALALPWGDQAKDWATRDPALDRLVTRLVDGA